MRAPHAAWLLLPLAIAAGNLQARSLVPAQVMRPAPSIATVGRHPMLMPALQVADGADGVQLPDAAIDGALTRFAAANAGKPGVAAALDGAAAEITRNTAAYVDSDGSVNKHAVQELVSQRFRDAGPVTLPSADGAGVSYPTLGAAPDGDIEALAIIVMIEAARSARDDLKSIMESTKTINGQKAAVRDAQRASNQALQDAKDAVQRDNHLQDGKDSLRRDNHVQDGKDSLHDEEQAMEGTKDSLSEMNEQDQLRLQMAMDRYSKLMSTLSNVMKKQSEASSAILGNMK